MRLLRIRNILLIYSSILTCALLYCIALLNQNTPSVPIGLQSFSSMIEKERQLREQLARLLLWEKKLQKSEQMWWRSHSDHALSIMNSLKDVRATIYVITPTYQRPTQKADLTRLAQTFLHLVSFHWIVIEDSSVKSTMVSQFLKFSGLVYTHLAVKTTKSFKLGGRDPNWLKPRGVEQRNAGLAWLRENLSSVNQLGVVYFADDDNTYDIRLFDEMRSTKRVSVWPVGLVGNLLYERPICINGRVNGWWTYWKPEREFALDMAGFAVNLNVILKFKSAVFNLRSKRGYLENDFLSQIVRREELEVKADDCTKVLVWHTQTQPADLRNEYRLQKLGKPGSDPQIEV